MIAERRANGGDYALTAAMVVMLLVLVFGGILGITDWNFKEKLGAARESVKAVDTRCPPTTLQERAARSWLAKLGTDEFRLVHTRDWFATESLGDEYMWLDRGDSSVPPTLYIHGEMNFGGNRDVVNGAELLRHSAMVADLKAGIAESTAETVTVAFWSNAMSIPYYRDQLP